MYTRKHEKYRKVPKRHVGHSEIHICNGIPRRRREIKAIFGDRIDVWRNTSKEVSKTDETHELGQNQGALPTVSRINTKKIRCRPIIVKNAEIKRKNLKNSQRKKYFQRRTVRQTIGLKLTISWAIKHNEKVEATFLECWKRRTLTRNFTQQKYSFKM